MIAGEAGLTCDGFLGGRLRLRQPRAGYRAAVDPVLLAAFAPAAPGDRVLDLGCGVGTAGLCLSARVAGLDLHGIELQPDYAALARLNAAENGLSMRVHEGDLRRPPPALRALSFDLALMNPPYHPARAATGARDAGRDAALREGEAALPEWVAAALRRLVPGGALAAVHLSGRLPALLAALDGPAGAIEVLPVAPRAGSPAGRVLVRARKGSRAALTLHPPLILHERVGGYSEDAEAVLRKGAALPFPPERDGAFPVT